MQESKGQFFLVNITLRLCNFSYRQRLKRLKTERYTAVFYLECPPFLDQCACCLLWGDRGTFSAEFHSLFCPSKQEIAFFVQRYVLFFSYHLKASWWMNFESFGVRWARISNINEKGKNKSCHKE